MKIKELEIAKEMYLEAKRIENLYHSTDRFEVRSEEFRKYNNEWVKADEEFQKNFCDEFDTLEIVNEYERRERIKKNEDNRKNESEVEKMRKKIAWLTNLMNVGVLSFLVLKNFSPLYGMIACTIAVLTILIVVIPEALTLKEVYNDEL